ncbi:MAG: hypothetical protein U5J97_10080 [Trueperaceae bacterium]|nr:hypothetical protein [Trueperaceae bacterium]
MPKLYLGEALGLLGKTLPFIWIRLGSYLLLGLGLGVYFGVIGGVAWLLGQLWAPLGFILFLAGIGGAFGIVRWVTRYYFYLLKAAHTAVMTEFIVHGRGPDEGQVAYGRKQVTERFKDTSIMFAVDQLVDGIVRRIVRTVVRIVDILPIPGIDSLGKLLERVALMSSTYVDESILSRAYAKREQNVWGVAHEGVVLYAQAWKPIVANAVVLTLIGYVEFFLLLVILGLPALAIAAVLPAAGPFLGVMVVVGAWMLKLAVADAWSLAATLLAYHRTTLDMTPDPAWVAKLEGMSDKFKELGRKAQEAVASTGGSGHTAGTAAPAATAADRPPRDAANDAAPSEAAAATMAAGAAAVDAVAGDSAPPSADARDHRRQERTPKATLGDEAHRHDAAGPTSASDTDDEPADRTDRHG